MILVDAPILLYASLDAYAQHRPARVWLEDRLGGEARVGLPWPSLLAFLRVSTHPRLFASPILMTEAWGRVRAWLACSAAWTPAPGERHDEVLARMLSAPGVQGNLVHDAHLAALAIEHGLELCSTDGDFARFPGLRWSNPLAG